MLSLPPFFCLPECNNSWGDLDALRGQHGSCRRPWQVFFSFCMFSLNYVHLLMQSAKRPVQITWPVRLSSCPPFHLFTSFQRSPTESYLTINPALRVEMSLYLTIYALSGGCNVTVLKCTWLNPLWPGLRAHRTLPYLTLFPVSRVERSPYATIPERAPYWTVPSISPVSMVERAPYWTVPYYIPCDRAWEVIVLDCIWLYSRVKGWEVTVMKCTWLYPLCPGLKGHRTSSCWKDKPQNYWLSEERKIWMIM